MVGHCGEPGSASARAMLMRSASTSGTATYRPSRARASERSTSSKNFALRSDVNRSQPPHDSPPRSPTLRAAIEFVQWSNRYSRTAQGVEDLGATGLAQHFPAVEARDPEVETFDWFEPEVLGAPRRRFGSIRNTDVRHGRDGPSGTSRCPPRLRARPGAHANTRGAWRCAAMSRPAASVLPTLPCGAHFVDGIA